MIFHSALVRELRATSGVVFAALFLIVVSAKVVRYLDRASLGKIDQTLALPLIGLSTAGSIALIVSLTAFISILLVLGRWWRDSEMVVWLASGASLWNLWRPVGVFVFPLALLSAAASTVLTPWSRAEMERILDNHKARSSVSAVTPGQFRETANSNGRQVLFVEMSEGAPSRLGRVFSVTTDLNSRSTVLIGRSAEMAADDKGRSWVRIADGTRTDFLASTGVMHQNLQTTRFRFYEVRTDLQVGLGERESGLRARGTLALLESSKPSDLGELAFRIAAPLLTIALGVLAIPLSYVGQRVTRWYSLVLALLLLILSNNLLALIQAWVAKGQIDFFWAWWPLPLGLVSFALGLTWFRARARRSFRQAIYTTVKRWFFLGRQRDESAR